MCVRHLLWHVTRWTIIVTFLSPGIGDMHGLSPSPGNGIIPSLRNLPQLWVPLPILHNHRTPPPSLFLPPPSTHFPLKMGVSVPKPGQNTSLGLLHTERQINILLPVGEVCPH